MNAALYARYSSSLQRPTSIDDQVSLCRQHAQRHGFNVADEQVFTDVELSGATSQRPGYQQLLEAARRGEFEAIIVEAQDRLWRDQAEMHTALRRLRFWSVRVYSVETESDLTDQSGRLVATVKGLMDEAYLDSLREKTRRGMLGQVRRGFSPGGHPYGYRSELITDATRTDVHGRPEIIGARRVVHPDEARIVTRILTMYAEGHSPKAIAKQLNAEGVPPPFWRIGKPNRGWTPSAINGQRRLQLGILNNPIYVGRQVWNRTRKVRDPDSGRRVWRLQPAVEWVIQENPGLRIISDELWAAVQARRLAVSRNTSLGGAPPRYLLSGLVVCGMCGAAYSIVGGSGKYGCTGHYYRAMCTNKVIVKRQLLEDWIVGKVIDRMLAPAAMARFAKRFEEAVRRRIQRPDNTAALRSAEDEMARLLEATRLGRGDIPELVQMLREATDRLSRLRAQQTQPEVDLRMLPQMAGRYIENLRALINTDVARAREALRRFLEPIRIEPNENGAVAVVRGNLSGILGIPVCNLGAGGRT